MKARGCSDLLECVRRDTHVYSRLCRRHGMTVHPVYVLARQKSLSASDFGADEAIEADALLGCFDGEGAVQLWRNAQAELAAVLPV